MKTTTYPPRKILVAVDASQPSWAALEAAKKLALKSGSVLEAVYVRDLLPAPPFESALKSMQRAQRDRRAEVELGVAAAFESFPAGRWSLNVLTGLPTAALLRLAHPRYAQLLVMGTHARQGSERFLMGSTAEVVFHRARIPVLAVRAGSLFHPRRMLVPCNLKSYADEALRYALNLAPSFGAKVTALYVPIRAQWDIDADDDLRRHIEEAFGAAARSGIEIIVRQGEPREQIALEARTGRYGLVLLSGHHRDQLSDLALGTTAERLLRSCPAPLLVVPASRDASLMPLATSHDARR